MANTITQRVKSQINAGEAPPHMTFIRRVIEDPNHLGLDSLEDASYLGMMLIIGASDTVCFAEPILLQATILTRGQSRISTWSFLEAMLTFPDVCNKARKVIGKSVDLFKSFLWIRDCKVLMLIDSAVGDRVPVFEDLERVPYIRQVMKESWRWRPPVALGHPHTTTRDIIYKDYRIPKGARIHLNAWLAMIFLLMSLHANAKLGQFTETLRAIRTPTISSLNVLRVIQDR